MDTDSRLYHKAMATIAKQAVPAATTSSKAFEPLPTTAAERRAIRERVFDLHFGTLFFSF
jgi:hypothetical protein